ncbi:hypothetical protein B0H19DRAFT_712940 [Mycena capillaripes]|nr:hypothetical protein B0H19DRAFT_712940 [Mycena capillaripes]
MPFIDLGVDVLGHIFALSDVYTILSLSRANRLFHEITSTKQLWLSVVSNLVARQLIDTPLVDIDKMTKDALIDEVKRVVDGPQTWSPKSLVPPKLSRRHTVEVDSRAWVELLPGNAYMLCYFGDPFRTVGCLDIHSGRLAWEWSRPGFSVNTATLEFLGTSEAVVALTVLNPTDRSVELVILQADLKTGYSDDLVHFSWLMMTLRNLQLSGDFFICNADLNRHHFILLLNWRAEKFMVFDNTTRRLPNLRMLSSFFTPFESFMLLPGHLVLARQEYSPGYTKSLQLHLYSITNFDHLWRPTREFNLDDLIEVKELPSVHLQVDDPRPIRYGVTLSCGESLLHDETYELLIKVYILVPPPPLPRFASLLKRLRIRSPTPNRRPSPEIILCRYHIALPAQRHSSFQLPQLTFKSLFRHSQDLVSNSRAICGLESRYPKPHLIYRLDEAGIQTPKELDVSFPSPVRLTQSGAIFLRRRSRAEILYYQ